MTGCTNRLSIDESRHYAALHSGFDFLTKALIIRQIAVFDDESGFEFRNGSSKSCTFDAPDDFTEILVRHRGFVFRVGAAVRQNIARVELLVDASLVEFLVGFRATHLSACSVIDAVTTLHRPFLRDHHDRTVTRVARQQNRVADALERRAGE